jgi:hypothetical protein
MPCGHAKKAKTSKKLTATQKAKLSAAVKGRKGKPMSAAARRKLADTMKCVAAAKGHCAKTTPAKAKSAAAAHKKKVKKAGVRVCTANAATRHSKSTPRRLSVVTRTHVMHQVRGSVSAHRLVWTKVSTSRVSRAQRIAQRQARVLRAASKRPRAVHAQRLHCHTVYRKSVARTKATSTSRCPTSKKAKAKKK